MTDRFKDQVAIITGGARGIGEGIAIRIAREGGKVILFDVLEDDLKKATSAMRDQGLDADYHMVDITNETEVRQTIDAVVKKYGKLDVMVNAAGVAGPNAIKISDYTYDDFRKVVDVNLHGSFLMTKYSIPHMLDNDYGRILLIASIGGREGNPGMVGYAASKSGVMGLVKGVGKEYADTNITVNGLCPAVIATPMNLDTEPATMSYMTAKIPMGRLGTIDEVAALSCWIISPEASFNTAYNFDISGGRATN